jgi:hypothetical protein
MPAINGRGTITGRPEGRGSGRASAFPAKWGRRGRRDGADEGPAAALLDHLVYAVHDGAALAVFEPLLADLIAADVAFRKMRCIKFGFRATFLLRADVLHHGESERR